jgi:hypothetical protein
MSEAHDDDYQEQLEGVRMRTLVAETAERVLELAEVFSAFEAVAQG